MLGLTSISTVVIISLAVFFGLLILNIVFKTAKFIFKLAFTLIFIAIIAGIVLKFIFDISVIGLISGIFAVILIL